jgi:hypothetical protein
MAVGMLGRLRRNRFAGPGCTFEWIGELLYFLQHPMGLVLLAAQLLNGGIASFKIRLRRSRHHRKLTRNGLKAGPRGNAI